MENSGVRSNKPFSFKLPLVLDGATGSNLILAGLPTGECVEQWVFNNPDVIIGLQKEFVKAGSDVVYAPTFSANRQKLSHYGLEDKTEELVKALVGYSKQACGENALVAGDISPTGEFCEPFGMLTFDEMIDIFQEQARAIYEAGADLFVIETMMSLSEIRSAVIACKNFDLPIFVTITVDESGHTLTGATPLSCLISLQEMGISAFGLNCSYGPEAMAEFIAEIAPFAKIPLIAKPNAGQPCADDENGCTYELSPEDMGREIEAVLKSGAKIVGGCCGNTPKHVAEIAKTVHSFDFDSVVIEPQDTAFALANESQAFFLNHEVMTVSEPMRCEVDMADELIELSDESFDVIKIEVETADDGYHFAQNAHMCRLPVLFKAEVPDALYNALKYYNGRAMVDSMSSIEPEKLREICAEFGAVIW